MNNKFFNIIISLSLLGLVSCDDELTSLEPFTEVDPVSFLDNISAFENAVDGVYSQLWNYYASSGSGLQGMPDILSDNTIQVQSGRGSNDDYHDFRYGSNTLGAIPLYWSEAYEAINAANVIISAIDNIEDGEDKDNILAQTLAARAWAHFDLVRLYGKIPTQSADADSSLGVVYVTFEAGDTGDPFITPARELVSDNYTEIIQDLETASLLIAEDNGEGRLNRNGVYGLLSRVYLYNGEYQKAIDAANEVTTALATADELSGVYTDSNSAGIVVELAVNTSSESDFENVGVLYSQSDSANNILEFAIDYGFFNGISDDDARKDVIQFVGVNDGVEYNAIRKFLGEEGQVNGLVDIKVMRASEVLLNKAEAQFELNLEADALSSLNELRALRYDPFVPGNETGEDLEDAIQYERRVELCFEGHRFFDLKRRGEDIVRSDFGEVIDGSGTAPEVLIIESESFRFQFPIPIVEINANPVIADQQNDGY